MSDVFSIQLMILLVAKVSILFCPQLNQAQRGYD